MMEPATPVAVEQARDNFERTNAYEAVMRWFATTLAFVLFAGLGLSAPARAIDDAEGVGKAGERARPPGWILYLNKASGTVVEFPSGLFPVEAGAPPMGAGQRFTSRDGRAQLAIYALPNDRQATPEIYLKTKLRLNPATLHYQRVTDRFFAISGITGERIFYSRCNFAPAPAGNMHCIYLEYPAGEKRAWDRVVTRISRSLRAAPGVALR
jgi:hypothetical protein